MKIMRVVELDLISNKERLEYELEEMINTKNINSSEKVEKIKEILLKLTETMNAIQLWSSYIEGLNNNEQKENKKN
jgi:hypothetical protein|tara:strand:+ start:2159 stop:2386 length:228 start_codon:yes stop_codon:yes gene_type:complete